MVTVKSHHHRDYFQLNTWATTMQEGFHRLGVVFMFPFILKSLGYSEVSARRPGLESVTSVDDIGVPK